MQEHTTLLFAAFASQATYGLQRAYLNTQNMNQKLHH